MAAETKKPVEGRKTIVLPMGLFVALGLYGLLVLLFIWWRYWSSPEYQAAEHWEAANEILGLNEGLNAPPNKLIEAYEHLNEVGRLMPQLREVHERCERLNSRFVERHISQPIDLRRKSEANAAVYQRLMQERAPILVIGVRDRGWAPDQLLEGPGLTLAYSTVGVLVIFVVWAYGQWNAKRIKQQEHEAELRKMEAEVKALGERPPPRTGKSPRR